MRLGVVFPSYELPSTPTAARAFAVEAERRGFDHLSFFDHVLGASHDREEQVWGPYDEHDRFFDPFVLIGFLAGVTERITFATGVLILAQRQTVLVARQAADAALLSGNRLRLGIGTGWNSVEYAAMGQEFRGRGARTDAQLALLGRLWTEDLVTADVGRERVDRAGLVPHPTARIPVWIGGGEAAYPRAVAGGDGFMFAGSAGRSIAGLEQLRGLLTAAGRDVDAFGADLVLLPKAPAGDPWAKQRERSVDRAVEALERWRNAGGTHATIQTTWMGHRTVEEHLDYAGAVAAQL